MKKRKEPLVGDEEEDGDGTDTDERSRPLNHRSFSFHTENTVTGLTLVRNPTIQKPKFVLSRLAPEEQMQWKSLWRRLTTEYFSSEKFMHSGDVEELIIKFWNEQFPGRASSLVTIDGDSGMKREEIRAVPYPFEVPINCKAHQRIWNIRTTIKDYVFDMGLTYYGLTTEKDGLKRVQIAGSLLAKYSFLYPNKDSVNVIPYGSC